MDDEKGQPVDGKILELARAIMERAPELRIKNEEADQAFEKNWRMHCLAITPPAHTLGWKNVLPGVLTMEIK